MKKFYFVLLMILLVHSAPAALTYSFDKITDNETGLRVEPTQFTMMLEAESSSRLLITFSNQGPLMSSITGIYFGGDTLFEYERMVGLGSAVAFSQYATPENLPGGMAFGFEADRDLSFDSDAPNKIGNGLNIGESLGIMVVLKPTKTCTDILNALAVSTSGQAGVESLRVGIHVQSIESEESGRTSSESFLLNAATRAGMPIPEPATLIILSVGMLLTKQPRRNRIY